MRREYFSAVLVAAAVLITSETGRAQPAATPSENTNPPAPMNWSANQDHQNMMDQLGIKTLRPGAEGMNRQAPNYQNTDEAKANPYPDLPDPLTLKNGQKVTTPEIWWKLLRPEIVEDFDREVYGRVPNNVPPVTWKVTSTVRTTNGAVPVITKELVGHVDNSSYPLINVDIQLTLTTPANAKGPVPVMMEFGFGNFGAFGGFGRGRVGGTNRIGAFGGTNGFRAWAARAALVVESTGNSSSCPMAGVAPSSSPPVTKWTTAPA